MPPDLAPATQNSLRDGFLKFFEQADEWRAKSMAIVVTDPEDKATMKQARDARLALKSIRVNADKTRKELKEESLRRGNAIQGVYNVLVDAIAPLEQHLENQEKYAERVLAQRQQALRDARTEALHGLNFTPPVDLATLTEQQFESMLQDAKDLDQLRRDREAREEQERQAAAEAANIERIRINNENARLKREAEVREEAARIEHEKAQAEKAAAEAALKAEREAREKVEREAAELKAAEDRRLAAEQAAKEKAEAERIAAEKKAAKAPDSKKLKLFATQLVSLPLPEMSTPEGNQIITKIRAEIAALAARIEAVTL